MTQKIVITGISHGIGKSTAEKFAAEGWEVFGCGSNGGDGRGMEIAEGNPRIHYMQADISQEEEVRALFAWCGPVDAAFNNAGIGFEPREIHLMDAAQAKRVLEVNLFGAALCMKYECDLMLKHAGGVIVNNASVSACKAATGADAVYAASKAGLLRLTAEAAAQAAYRDRIKFFSVIPGWIETRMTAADDKEEWKRKLPSGRIGRPKQVAELVYAIVNGQNSFESGQEFQINGGGFLL